MVINMCYAMARRMLLSGLTVSARPGVGEGKGAAGMGLGATRGGVKGTATGAGAGWGAAAVRGHVER